MYCIKIVLCPTWQTTKCCVNYFSYRIDFIVWLIFFLCDCEWFLILAQIPGASRRETAWWICYNMAILQASAVARGSATPQQCHAAMWYNPNIAWSVFVQNMCHVIQSHKDTVNFIQNMCYVIEYSYDDHIYPKYVPCDIIQLSHSKHSIFYLIYIPCDTVPLSHSQFYLRLKYMPYDIAPLLQFYPKYVLCDTVPLSCSQFW